MLSKEESILLSAEKLFAEKGFDGTSTREISKEAGANVSMIAYYFGSKEKLLERIFENRMKESMDFATVLLHRKDIVPWRKLEILIDRYVDRVRTLKSFFLLLQREKLNLSNPAIVEVIRTYKKEFLIVYGKIINEGIKRGEFKKANSLELIHFTVTGTLYNSMSALLLKNTETKITDSEELKFYNKIKKHLKKTLKYLLEYEAEI